MKNVVRAACVAAGWCDVVAQGQEHDHGHCEDGCWRASAMVDYAPSSFSRIRLQVNHGRYDRTEAIWEGFAQLTLMFGSHRY